MTKLSLGTTVALATVFLLPAVVSPAEKNAKDVKRPRILGISHAAFFVSDMDKARSFYKDFLGYDEPYSLPKSSGASLHVTWIKINDLQSVELFPEREAGSDRLYQVALLTDDAEALRHFLGTHGIKVPEKTPVGRIGNANFTVKDPDGHTIEIVQYLPEGWTTKDRGKHLPDTRIAPRMNHVGFMVADLETSMKFYHDLLGFQETWRGSSNGRQLSWVNMKVPDGDDYVEFMLYGESPTPDRMRTMNHICLEAPDVARVEQVLKARTQPAGSKPATPLKAGINRKRQINTFDPDGTRVEIMEPGTIDGMPAPSSTAPPPTGRAPEGTQPPAPGK